MEDWRALITVQMSLFSMTDTERITLDEAKVIILLDGELVVEHQKCDTCKFKTTILTHLGSHIYLAPKTTHRLKNRMMKRVLYMEIETNSDKPE